MINITIRNFFLCSSLCIVMLLSGCNGANKESTATMMPEAKPDHFNFSVSFGYGTVNKNEINTFNNTVTKDLVTKGTATANLILTNEEMTDIYDRMREIDVLRELELDNSDSNCSSTPVNEDHWEIQVEGEQRTFDWSSEKCDLTDDAIKLEELRNYIFDIVKEKKEYRELPEAAGGYD